MNNSLCSSWYSLDTDHDINRTRTLNEEVSEIRLSLDLVHTRLISQQNAVAREFEDRVRTVYDSVINDLNDVRKQVNTIGDTAAISSKYKAWAPVAPFRKSVLKSVYEIQRPVRKLKSSKSVDFLDSNHNNRERGGIQRSRSSLEGKSRLSASTTSVDSKSRSRSKLPGYGCCFYGDNKTIPHRSYRARHSFYRDPTYSWCTSNYGSRSTLGDDDRVDHDKGCMCGEVTDDWRVSVAPYMWDGWPIPGLERDDVEKLKERLEKFEEFREETIAVHNEYRSRHGCPELLFSEGLSRDAMQWAELLTAKGYAQYSESISCGENILVVDIESELSGRQVVDTWYREHSQYNYTQPKWQRGTSNFTQMIWKSSRFIGVGIAKYPYHDTYIIVVRYQPPGNRNTPFQFKRNVPPPLTLSEKTAELSQQANSATCEADYDVFADNEYEKQTHIAISPENCTTLKKNDRNMEVKDTRQSDATTELGVETMETGKYTKRQLKNATKHEICEEQIQGTLKVNKYSGNGDEQEHERCYESIDQVKKSSLPSHTFNVKHQAFDKDLHPESDSDNQGNECLSNCENTLIESKRPLPNFNFANISDSKEIYYLSLKNQHTKEIKKNAHYTKPVNAEECPYATIADFDKDTSVNINSINIDTEQKHGHSQDDKSAITTVLEQPEQLLKPKKQISEEHIYATVVKPKQPNTNNLGLDLTEDGYARIPADKSTKIIECQQSHGHRKNTELKQNRENKQPSVRRRRTVSNTKRRTSIETDV